MRWILGADKHRWLICESLTPDQLAGEAEQHQQQVPIGTIHAVDPVTGVAACGVEPRALFPRMFWPPATLEFATPCEECTRRTAIE